MKTERKSHRSIKAPFVTSMTLAVCIFVLGNVPDASGQMIVAVAADTSITGLMTQYNTQVQQLEMIGERISEVNREVDRVKNLATNATSLISGLTTVTMQEPKKRPADHGMKRCEPDFSGFSLSDVFTLLVPSLSKSVPEQQRAICKQIVAIKNQRHNDNVDLLQSLKGHVLTLKKATDNFKSAKTSGDQMSNLGEQTKILNTITVDIQYSQAITRVYDNTINSLEDDSKQLAEDALNGKKKGLGESLFATGAQTVALCGGLMAAKSSGSDFSCGL